MLDKLDKLWIGLIIGLILPFFCFFCYWLFFHSQLNFPFGLIRYLQGGNILQEIAMVCVVFNLIIFYLLLNKKAYSISRGLMFATFVHVGFIFYISLL